MGMAIYNNECVYFDHLSFKISQPDKENMCLDLRIFEKEFSIQTSKADVCMTVVRKDVFSCIHNIVNVLDDSEVIE